MISRIGEHLFAARSRTGDVGSASALNRCAESVKACRIQRSSFRIAREGHLLTVTFFFDLEMNTESQTAPKATHVANDMSGTTVRRCRWFGLTGQNCLIPTLVHMRRGSPYGPDVLEKLLKLVAASDAERQNTSFDCENTSRIGWRSGTP